MFAFFTKFKTEVRDFIAEAGTKLGTLETKIDTEFADLKAKVEGLFKAKETEAVQAVADKVVEAVAPKTDDTPPPPAA